MKHTKTNNFRTLSVFFAPLFVVAGCAAPTTEEEPDENIGQAASAFSVTSSTFELGRIGGTSGNAGTLRCADSRDVIVGLRGRSGNVVDSLPLLAL